MATEARKLLSDFILTARPAPRRSAIFDKTLYLTLAPWLPLTGIIRNPVTCKLCKTLIARKPEVSRLISRSLQLIDEGYPQILCTDCTLDRPPLDEETLQMDTETPERDRKVEGSFSQP